MANIGPDTAPDRYIIDTAGATLLRAVFAPHQLSSALKVKQIRWVGATTAGHQAVIQDANSVVLWESVAAGANNVESDQTERQWQGDFKVPTLGSGRLYIYLQTGYM